jgi:hypothetical protein
MDTPEQDPRAPTRVDQMIGATSDWTPLSVLLTKPDPPHLLLVGGAGTGKSCALRLILGASITLWIRCTKDSSLRYNRDKIKRIAQRHANDGSLNWVVLEHAEALHADAQAFLRRIMETTTVSTRFALEIRDARAIAEPLMSRTVLFNVSARMPYEIRSELMHRTGCSMERATQIVEEANGNIRWALTQGLTETNQSLVDPSVPSEQPTDWSQLLHLMRQTQQTGSNPRAVVSRVCKDGGETGSEGGDNEWKRPGGSSPWALMAVELSKGIPA